LWIIETEKDERFIISEEGLRILDEEVTGVTVLKDESLGGIEREYREVKRKAEVGERIVFDSDRPGITEGKPYNVRGGDLDGAEFFDNDGTRRWQNHVRTNCYVLEPTNIVRINGERFRMVDRKAAVGERVIVVSDRMCHAIPPGVIGQLEHSDTFDYDNSTYFVGNDVESDEERDYRVLEPLTSAEPAPLLSDKPAPDQAAELIAKLTTRVASLEKRVAALETPKSRPATDEEVTDALAKAAQRTSVTVAEVSADLMRRALEARENRARRLEQPRVVFSRPATYKLPSYLSDQQRRDAIVEQAKADVADLLTCNYPDACGPLGVWFSTEGGTTITDRVDFIVNREKRTVVALVIELDSNKAIGRGIAKCAPGDVFNSHIGRAIALRRALGLEVPAEYFEAPNPTEINCGDIIAWMRRPRDFYTVGQREGKRVFVHNGVVYPDTYVNLTVGDHVYIADDSAEPRKEVA